MSNNNCMLVKIIVDFVILLIVGIPILIFHLNGKPFERGFHCDDDSIRYPFRDSTISNKVLYIVGVFLPVIVITLTEFTNDACATLHEKRKKMHVVMGRPIPHAIWKVYIRVGVFLFGACMSQITTDIAKYSIGRLRPHFLDVCKPTIDCSKVEDPHQYVYAICTGDDLQKIREARLSFPSGHSSFSAYTMIYTAIYLQACMQCRTNRLLKPFLQFILLMMTWYTALSRITDYKHHWSDVLFGFLQGTLVAVITAYFVSDLFTKDAPKEEGISLQNISIDAPPANYSTMDPRNPENENH